MKMNRNLKSKNIQNYSNIFIQDFNDLKIKTAKLKKNLEFEEIDKLIL